MSRFLVFLVAILAAMMLVHPVQVSAVSITAYSSANCTGTTSTVVNVSTTTCLPLGASPSFTYATVDFNTNSSGRIISSFTVYTNSSCISATSTAATNITVGTADGTCIVVEGTVPGVGSVKFTADPTTSSSSSSSTGSSSSSNSSSSGNAWRSSTSPFAQNLVAAVLTLAAASAVLVALLL